MARMTQFRRGRLLFDVRDEGPVDGDTVVLLHGFPQDATAFDRVTPILHGEGLRTVALDQRGYSPGARPPGRSPYRLEHLADDVLALLDTAGLDRVHLLGHDWGAVVAWAVAGLHPDRVRSLTSLSIPHPRAGTRALIRSTQLLRFGYVGVAQLPGVPEALLNGRLERLLLASGLPPSYAAHYAGRMSEPGALTAALAWYRALPLSRLQVSTVRVPTTLVWGNGDPAITRTAAELTVEHVDAPYRFIELPTGHWLPEREPEEVAAAVVDQIALMAD